MFSDLARQYPHLEHVIQRLSEEHRTVERLRGELEALLADVATADPDRFRADLELMAAELEAHLDFEEAELIPTLADIPMPPTA